MGFNVDPKKYCYKLENLYKLLKPNETIVFVTVGFIKESKKAKETAIVVTSRRVILYQSKFSGYDFTAFSYDSIHRITENVGLTLGKLQLLTHNESVEIISIPALEFTELTRVIRIIRDHDGIMTREEIKQKLGLTEETIRTLNQPIESLPVYRKIPGFRSGTKWKMVIATIFYSYLLFGILNRNNIADNKKNEMNLRTSNSVAVEPGKVQYDSTTGKSIEGNTSITSNSPTSTQSVTETKEDIKKAQEKFREWAIKNTAVTEVHFESSMFVWVKLKPEKYTNEDNVTQIARSLAKYYVSQTGVSKAIVTVWRGDKVYAKGNSWD
jgi:hypothetical protein